MHRGSGGNKEATVFRSFPLYNRPPLVRYSYEYFRFRFTVCAWVGGQLRFSAKLRTANSQQPASRAKCTALCFEVKFIASPVVGRGGFVVAPFLGWLVWLGAVQSARLDAASCIWRLFLFLTVEWMNLHLPMAMLISNSLGLIRVLETKI